LLGRRREAGVSTDSDWLQAEGSYQAAAAELANLQQQQAAAENLLTLLVGQSMAEMKDLPAGRSLAEQGISSDLFAGLPAEILLRRPDVLAAEQQLIAAAARARPAAAYQDCSMQVAAHGVFNPRSSCRCSMRDAIPPIWILPKHAK
jgi:multidrug efflux system outer membrane protein